MTYSEFELQRIQINRGRTLFATPEIMKEKLIGLADDYGVGEIMLVTYAEKFEDRLHSYELLADMFQLN